MKLVFVSNYMNHHQRCLCDHFYRLLGKDFLFISTSAMREERKHMGYGYDEAPVYEVKWTGESENERYIAGEILRADAVIAGSAPERLIFKRIREGKLTFRYYERPLRHGLEPVKYVPRFFKWHMQNPVNKPVYLLCASAFASSDYAKFGLFKGKAYRWGYFTQAKRYDVNRLFAGKNQTEILWCGRLLPLKHPQDVLEVAARLKKDGYDFTVNMIGAGPLEDSLRARIDDSGLSDCVRLLGAMTPGQVRTRMEQAAIFLFTSDRQEGWGAVLNESMNSGCAVVASHAIGSVPYLLRDGENGSVYTCGDVDMLYRKVRYLLDNPDEQVRLGLHAYETITALWNPEIAASRFVELSNQLLSGESPLSLYETGPCSRAEMINENWYQNEDQTLLSH